MGRLNPGNTQFAILSFEGPDEYSRAGGLATRVRDLSEALAMQGFTTHLFFVGDPYLPGMERRGCLTLHRWGQWISAFHPDGVYDGEWGKLNDFQSSVPGFLLEQIVRPGTEAGMRTVVMGEDWQMAGTMIALFELATAQRSAQQIIPLWTANNTYGFDGIDFTALAGAAGIATVSRYMKHQMRAWNVDPLVTPNGITPAAMVDVDRAECDSLRDAFNSDLALFKIGRFSPDKRWNMAIEAVAMLRRMGTSTRLLMRGDKLPYGQEVLAQAAHLGLRVEYITERFHSVADLTAAIRARPEAAIINLATFVPDEIVPVIYASVDGVLANSGHEPFGLVGLEVMAAGGLAVVGATGEDYAEPGRNAIVLDTDDPFEIVVQFRDIRDRPDTVERIKRAGRETAKAYLWPAVLQELLSKLEYVALARAALRTHDGEANHQ